MTTLERDPKLSTSTDAPPAAAEPVDEVIEARMADLGEGTQVRRLLPRRQRRLIGAWCFLDHFGPSDISGRPGMRVGPHPHIGLQTVSWLLDGELLHRDSLGSLQLVRPGQLNLMTAGAGIAHSEESPEQRPPVLHGVQLWVALPDEEREGSARFEHHPELPVADLGGGVTATVIAGGGLGERSPAMVHSPLVGLELRLPAGTGVAVPLEPGFEHGVVPLDQALEVDGVALSVGQLLYLGRGRSDVRLRADAATRVLVVGGEPFGSEVLVWWNFVARTREEIERAREDWQAGERFGEVHGFDGPRIEAPPVPWRPSP